MAEQFLNIDHKKKKGWSGQLQIWFNQQLVGKRFNSPAGYVVLILIAIVLSGAIGFLGWKMGVVLLLAIIGVPVLLASVFNLRFGLITFFIISFFIILVSRNLSDIPLGMLLDAFIVLMFFGLLVKQIGKKDWNFIKNPVSWLIVAWIGYNLIEVFNPWAYSRLAWVYTIRSVAGIMLVYFIAMRAINSLNFVSLIFKIWIGLAFLAALYGLKQEYIGFADGELSWIMSSEERFSLFFNWGRWRRFSFFSDPTVFGILMAYTSLLCFVLVTAKMAGWKKLMLLVAGCTMLLAMVYTGTRTAFAVVPVGVVFFTVITFRKKIMITVGLIMLMAAAVLISPVSSLGPLDSNSLNRIRSAFIGEEDPSYQVRMRNQEFIQPYIWNHPIGGGLGSIGVWGARFSPDSPIADFAPDSGFVRVAVEQGWVGLILYMAFIFMIFRCGVRYYLLCEHPKIKVYYVATLTVLFCLMVANYPQQAFAIYPTIVVFYICVAIVMRLKDFDDAEMHKLTGGIQSID